MSVEKEKISAELIAGGLSSILDAARGNLISQIKEESNSLPGIQSSIESLESTDSGTSPFVIGALLNAHKHELNQQNISTNSEEFTIGFDSNSSNVNSLALFERSLDQLKLKGLPIKPQFISLGVPGHMTGLIFKVNEDGKGEILFFNSLGRGYYEDAHPFIEAIQKRWNIPKENVYKTKKEFQKLEQRDMYCGHWVGWAFKKCTGKASEHSLKEVQQWLDGEIALKEERISVDAIDTIRKINIQQMRKYQAYRKHEEHLVSEQSSAGTPVKKANGISKKELEKLTFSIEKIEEIQIIRGKVQFKFKEGITSEQKFGAYLSALELVKVFGPGTLGMPENTLKEVVRADVLSPEDKAKIAADMGIEFSSSGEFILKLGSDLDPSNKLAKYTKFCQGLLNQFGVAYPVDYISLSKIDEKNIREGFINDKSLKDVLNKYCEKYSRAESALEERQLLSSSPPLPSSTMSPPVPTSPAGLVFKTKATLKALNKQRVQSPSSSLPRTLIVTKKNDKSLSDLVGKELIEDHTVAFANIRTLEDAHKRFKRSIKKYNEENQAKQIDWEVEFTKDRKEVHVTKKGSPDSIISAKQVGEKIQYEFNEKPAISKEAAIVTLGACESPVEIASSNFKDIEALFKASNRLNATKETGKESIQLILSESTIEFLKTSEAQAELNKNPQLKEILENQIEKQENKKDRGMQMD